MKIIIYENEAIDHGVIKDITPTQLEAIKEIVEHRYDEATGICSGCGRDKFAPPYADKKEGWPEEIIPVEDDWTSEGMKVIDTLNFLLRRVKKLDERK